MFTSSHSRLGGLADRLPAVASLINKMALRKKRDNIILASVIAIGVILIFLYVTM